MAAPPVLTVLVVEDDAAVRGFLRRALEVSGLQVLETASADAALDVLAGDTAVDAALVDGLLPDMHGLDLGRRAVRLPHRERLGLCFLSGAVQGRVAATAGLACLQKPVRPADLVAELRGLGEWAASGGSPAEERSAALERLADHFLVGP